MTILAAQWDAARRITVREMARPRPGPRDVVVDIMACGICGSDVHRYVEGAWATPGMRLGHEFSGMVAEAGKEVSGLQPGDRVAVNPAVPCGWCRAYRHASSNLCETRVMAQGGFGEQVLVPDAVAGEQLFVMPESMSFEEGAFIEPLAVAVRAVRQLDPVMGEPIGVLGLGTVGQCVLQVLRAYGATDVVAIGVSPPRLAVARRSGAVALSATEDLREQIISRWGETHSPYQVAGPLGAVFECSGADPMIDLALEMTRAGGGVSCLGLTRNRPRVDVNAMVQKELRLRGSFAYTGEDAQEAFRLLSTGSVTVSCLVSHRFPLSAVSEAFECQCAANDSVKVIVVPDHRFASQ